MFYKEATFYSVPMIAELLTKAGFGDHQFCQTLFKPLGELMDTEPVRDGYGEGSFVVVRGRKG